MAKDLIKFAYPVESVQRKMTLRKNTASDVVSLSTGDGRVVALSKPVSRYMGAQVRTQSVKGLGIVKSNVLFVRFNKRSTPVTEDELAARLVFGKMSKLAKYWLKTSLQDTSAAREDYMNGNSVLGVNPYGRTFYGYVRGVAHAQIAAGGTITDHWPNQ